MTVCIAIIGKDNSPKYISCQNPYEELSFQYKLLSSLDVIDEKLSSGNVKTASDFREPYLGLLYSLETHKIYGYATNTKIKFLLVADSLNTSLRENEIKTIFKKLHSLYTAMMYNPFFTPGDVITSKSFDSKVKAIMGGAL